ncbi:MAG: tape measure protein [Bacillota bacterium]
MAFKIGDIFVKLGLKKDEFDKGLNEAKKETTSFGNAMNKIGGAIAGIFAVGAITGFVSNIIQVRKEFEKYEAVLANSLGSNQKARQEMKMLADIAAQTPFSLNELTSAYVKMVNYGLKPTKEQILKLGDLASSTGKGFEQLVEAVADSVTGQYERLKEFGIKASQSGDKVTFTFKEQKTTVDNNAASIKAYLVSLGDLQGVSGSMAAISATLGGRLSNLGDAWDSLLNTLGKGTSGVMFTVISWLNSFVSMLDNAYRSIEDIKKSVGDTASANAMNNALLEIDTIEKSLIKNGVDSIAAHKRAIELYVSSVDNRIKELNKSRKEGTYELKQQLIDEKNAVLNHFQELDKSNKSTTESGTKYKNLLKEIADQEKALQDLPRKSISYYEAEISLLQAKQKLLTDPKQIEASKSEISIKQDRLDQLTGELKLLEQVKLKNQDIIDLFTKGLKSDQPKSKGEQKNGLIINPQMQANMHASNAAADAYDEQIKRAQAFVDELNSIIQSGMTNAIESLASGLTELAMGDISGKEFGAQILAMVGNFMIQLGTAFIVFSKLFIAFQTAIASMNPVAALAIGVSLVAAGAAISTIAKKGMSKGGGGGTTSAASGYSPSGSSAIAAINGNVVFELQGTTLRGVLNNTDRKNNLIR